MGGGDCRLCPHIHIHIIFCKKWSAGAIPSRRKEGFLRSQYLIGAGAPKPATERRAQEGWREKNGTQLSRQQAGSRVRQKCLRAVLAALGSLLAPLWAVLALPGGPREAPGGSGEGLREAISVLFWMVQREKLKKRSKTFYFNDFGKFLVRVLAVILAFFLLAWHASGKAGNIEKP